jgi:hypothetical protein
MKDPRAGFVVLLAIACGLLRGDVSRAQSDGVDQEKALKVKAAYLLNFTKFVTWPAGAFENAQSPIVIGVVGTDPFGEILDQTLKDKTVEDVAGVVQRAPWRTGDDVSGLKKCPLLYISPSLDEHAEALIRALRPSPVLLVGEGESFAKIGGMIGFVIDNARIVFWACKAEANAAGLELSSQLLKLALPVETVARNSDRDAGTKQKGE